MTHSLHREGSVESLERDYCMLIYPARGWNNEGVTPKLQHLLELVFLENPSNLLIKTLHKNMYSGVTQKEMIDSVRDNSRAFCVFSRRERLAHALKAIKAADEGISITVSGLIEGVREICAEVELVWILTRLTCLWEFTAEPSCYLRRISASTPPCAGMAWSPPV